MMRLDGMASPRRPTPHARARGFPDRLVAQPDDGEDHRPPGMNCTWTSTGRASTPSNATVATRTVMPDRAPVRFGGTAPMPGTEDQNK